MRIGKFEFNTKNQKYIMGILNLTPDSFSDGGVYSDLDKALAHVGEMIAQGATIIDVGGMSTRPGHVEITVNEEIKRVLPVIQAIKEEFDIPVSLDTYRSEVVVAAAPYIDMVNDISGLSYDIHMAQTIAKYKKSVCVMANKCHQMTNDKSTVDKNRFITDIILELETSINMALDAGVPSDKIMIDGGVGFGKTYEQNLMIIHHTKDLVHMGYPVLMATSNKGFMREITGNMQANRSAETLATTVLGASSGASFFRVHHVEPNKRALDMYQAINTCTMPIKN